MFHISWFHVMVPKIMFCEQGFISVYLSSTLCIVITHVIIYIYIMHAMLKLKQSLVKQCLLNGLDIVLLFTTCYFHPLWFHIMTTLMCSVNKGSYQFSSGIVAVLMSLHNTINITFVLKFERSSSSHIHFFHILVYLNYFFAIYSP